MHPDGSGRVNLTNTPEDEWLPWIGPPARPEDSDGDGVPDDVDNCPADANPSQTNIDTDSFGYACDNCPLADNETQGDANTNGIGDVCEDCNGNGIPDPCDLDCGVPGGPCDVAECGSSPDCQPNGVPDECDIAERRGRDKFPPPHGDGIPDVCQLKSPEGR